MSTQLQSQAKTGSKSSDTATTNNAVKRHFSSQRGFSAEVERYPIQTKLKIGQPGDKYEQEADRVAEQVMRMPEPKVQRICPGYKEELQKQPLEEEEEELIQTKIVGDLTPKVTPVISSGIQSLQGSGRGLSSPERSFFEPRFGVDFSKVRLHNNMQAASAARSVNARAFTLGHNVVFGIGEYSPDASSGRKLLAHELTHVIQQNGDKNLFSTCENSESTILYSREFMSSHVASEYSVPKIKRSLSNNLQREVSPRYRRLLSILNIQELHRRRRLTERTLSVLREGGVTWTDFVERHQAILDELANRGFPPDPSASSASETEQPVTEFAQPATTPAEAPVVESPAEPEPGTSLQEERNQEVEIQLRPLFGARWQRVRGLILQHLPADQDPLRVNWKFVTNEPQVPITTFGSSMPLQNLRIPGMQGGRGLVRIQRMKCETGFYLTRPGNSFTIGINLTTGAVSFSWGSLKLTAFQGMEVQQQVGNFAVGVSLSLFNPLSTGITWKLGYEHKGEPQNNPGGYTFESFVEWCIEGDLSPYGRLALSAVYVTAAVAAGAGVFMAAEALAAALIAAGPALVPVIRGLIQVGPRLLPSPVSL